MQALNGVTTTSDQPDQHELDEAAKTWGIELDYWDIWHRQHHASPEVERAILASLGVDTSTRESLSRALEERAGREWDATLPPTVVLTAGRNPHQILVNVPASNTNARARIEIRFENGSSSSLPVALGDLPSVQETRIRSRAFVRKRVRLPDELPLGYHDLSIAIGGQPAVSARLIVCPKCAYQPVWLQSGRAAGVAISLYGLRSQRNWGCGDTTDLEAVSEWVANRLGASFIALNPLHAISNRQPFNTSPYLPNSIFYRNPIYLDVERIQEFRSTPRAAALLRSTAVQNEIQALRKSEFVEYERVYRLKLRFLKLLFRTFLSDWTANTPRARALQEYVDREGDLLHRFAVHSALDQAIHRRCPDVWTWRNWPEPYQDPNSAATAEFARKHWRSVLFHKYVQWQLDEQLGSAQQYSRERGLSIGLYHDLALATDRFGSDLWAHRDFFISGCRVGAPPDSFSPKGQDWAFPPPNTQNHFEDGYRLFSEFIRKNSRHGGALRIDHVMRFFRLYWIPDGMEATDGTYVRDRFQELLAILALESVREKVLIVGEDLGTVPDEIRDILHQFGILSYRLLYFEQDPDGRVRAPHEYPREALVSATTHDLPTLAGFWLARDIEARHDAGLLTDEATYRRMHEERGRDKQRMLDLFHQLGLLPDWFPRNAGDVHELTGELHNAIVGFLAATPSKLLALNQEDLLKETEQQNLPGSTAEYPNWRRKMKCTVEELGQSPELQAFAAMFHSWLERTGRINNPQAAEDR
jgi:4-alpha-glucanotransferase